MYTFTIILIILYTLIILYIFFKYNMEPKSKTTYDIYRDKLDIESTEAAYLLDKNNSTINLILSDILTLVNKGYIYMEKLDNDYLLVQRDKTDFTNVKNHEMLSYKIFFDEDSNGQITINQFIRNFSTNKEKYEQLELTNLSMRNAIELELFKKGVIDLKAKRKLLKYNKTAILLIIVSIIVAFLSYMFRFTDGSIIAFITLFFSAVLYSITSLNEEKLTPYGIDLKEKVKGFKNYLKQYVIVEDKPLYMVDILEYNYTMAVALGLANKAEDEFVEKAYNRAGVKKMASKCLITLIIILQFIYVLSLIDPTLLVAIGTYVGFIFVMIASSVTVVKKR